MKKNNKGFTLIELLVVIAIIGLLSTLAIVSLNNARAKARDAKRLSDVKQISNLFEMAAANQGTYAVFPESCDEAGDMITACGTVEGTDLSAFTDPSQLETPVPCSTANDEAGCDYALGADESSTDYEICFFLEHASGNADPGLNTISQGGQISGGCSN